MKGLLKRRAYLHTQPALRKKIERPTGKVKFSSEKKKTGKDPKVHNLKVLDRKSEYIVSADRLGTAVVPVVKTFLFGES